jgi:alpha-tubulin suppressor-like RCC1 family protein
MSCMKGFTISASALVFLLSAACDNGKSARDAGDEDLTDAEADGDTDTNNDADAEPDAEPDTESDEVAGPCEGAVDGTLCGDDPRSICLGGACVPSACGDGFADEAAGEECDDGGNVDPDDGCTDVCQYSCHENNDCEDDDVCSLDACDTGSTHACLHTPGAAGTPCRPSAGVCDVAESCDGVNLRCPDDAFEPSTTECRASTFPCDAAELCTGSSADCPADAPAPDGTACDDGVLCTYPDVCDGAGTCAGTNTTVLYRIAAVDLGESHTCIVMSSGEVKCWGRNDFGQIGDGTTTERHAPTDVVGLSLGVSATAAGRFHTCALSGTGGLKCWGQNWNGQLGDGTYVDRHTPVDVSGLTSGVSAVAAGFNHTCALMSTGGVKCWGWNPFGQVGDGTVTQRNTPVDVSGLASGVSAIAAGYDHTCALMSTGGVKCWGRNENGQLGDDTTTNQLTPVDVSGLTSGVTAVTGGQIHTCALMSTGGMKCWGGNNAGQLGDGTLDFRSTPVDVPGLSTGVDAIAADEFNTCALMDVGNVKCWGYNLYGQVGDGTTTDQLTPVDVLCPW